MEALLPALLSPNKRMRRRSMTLLPRLDPEEVCRQLDPVLETGSRKSRRAACVALAAIGAPAEALLTRLVDDSDETIRNRAARALEAIAARPPEPADRTLSSVRPFGLPYRDAPPPRPRSFGVAAFNFLLRRQPGHVGTQRRGRPAQRRSGLSAAISTTDPQPRAPTGGCRSSRLPRRRSASSVRSRKASKSSRCSKEPRRNRSGRRSGLSAR